ncbi:centrosome-associated protein CEP250-like [Patagioenas fasciata]|uniref:centrosome-associated protein CEP250-like n=1 Tax=Patagioenas fasciata TaxID=372321 RepID=UPI003A990D0C
MAAPSQGSLRRRLQSSQEAQHRQALVVRKLQAKVLQYRTRCRELEQQVEAAGGSLPGRREATEDQSLEKALLRLEEEQQRCENLAEVNALLREQLDEAGEVNSALKEDVAKLTADWMRAREELGLKESERRREREVYDSYVRGEHQRLLSLWCQVVTFRRQFLEMKAATDRDLSELKAEHMRLSGAVLVSCSRPTSGDLEKKELQDRVLELSALLVPSQKKNEEKEKPMETPDNTVEILVCFPLIWGTAQCLLPSRSTQRCGFLSRRRGRDATCRGTSGTLPECSLCVWHRCSQSGCSSGRGAADSSGVFLRGCTKAVVPGVKVPWHWQLPGSLWKRAVGLSLLSFSEDEVE